MQLKRFSISLFLIFAYSIGFAHDFVPHCADADHTAHGTVQINHESSHNHCLTEKKDHSHISHSDHFDDGLIDYLICIFESSSHHTDDCHVGIHSSKFESNSEISILSDTQIAASNFDFTSVDFSISENSKYDDFIPLPYNKGFENLCPHRGPPTHTS